jgi:NADH:ubiquinone oxidoreductase subunit 3 (subunit A)
VNDVVLQDVVFSLFFVFVVSTFVVLMMFWLGGRLGGRGRKTPDRLASYACGEDMPPAKLQVNAEKFFMYSLFFLILDSFAFLLFLSFAKPGIYPILFSFITLIAVVMTFPKRRY